MCATILPGGPNPDPNPDPDPGPDPNAKPDPKPNLHAKVNRTSTPARIDFFAIRPLRTGDELLIDYGVC